MKIAMYAALALALSLPVQAQWPPRELRPDETLNKELAIVTRPQQDDAASANPEELQLQERAGITCSITFYTPLVYNGYQSLYDTNYGGSGCVKGNIVETVTWNWASSVSDYGEFEIQKKQIDLGPFGCLAGSGHVVSAPTGTGINGPTKVYFEARDWPGNNLICSATAVLTVN